VKIIENYRRFVHTHGKNDIVAAIVTIIFSVGLLGGFKYLIYDLSQEYQTYVELSSRFDRQIEELKLHQEMVKVVASGWYYVPENIDKEVSLLTILSSVRDTQELPEDFAISAKTWCQESNVQISSDIVRIEAFQFTIEQLQKYKSRHLKLYEAHRSQILLICNLVTNWSSLSQASRAKALEEIFSKANELQIVFASYEAEGNQIEWEIEQKRTENKRIQTEINWIVWLMIIKSLLSVIGIGAGLLTIKLFFEKDGTKQSKTNRKWKAG
jgi:hypothetical protein